MDLCGPDFIITIPKNKLMPDSISFQDFKSAWVQEISHDSPSTTEIGRRFVHKLFCQWRDISSPSDDLIYCDGPGDGGIDLAYLERTSDDNGEPAGDIWYLIQGKFGTSSRGPRTIMDEGKKLIETLYLGENRLSYLADNVVSKLTQFVKKANPDQGDRLVYIYASDNPLTAEERRTLDDVRSIGRERLGILFDVEAISIETIYLNTLDDPANAAALEVRVSMNANMAVSGEHLLVGSVPLLDLYQFLKDYRAQTENIDQLYDKNVRLFLGGRGKVNKGMQATLLKDPGQFGLYNNGITLVVNDFKAVSHRTYELVEPYVVNGCQTTRTIWEVFQQKLESGGSGVDPDLEGWRDLAGHGVVVAKIVRVAKQDGSLLHNITRFTNSQNAVKDKDFITLDEGFHTWKEQMDSRYSVFLEVQRGAWDSRRAVQKQNPGAKQFDRFANAFDLLKVYGAGWLREAGRAFSRNAMFVPGGKVFKAIVEQNDIFGVEDLYAAFRLQEAADEFDFGRGSVKISRRLTRFLFYLVVMDILRDILIRANLESSPTNLTRAFNKLVSLQDPAPLCDLLEAAVAIVDEYLTQGEQESVFNEPAFVQRFNGNLNGFLKWDQLGKSEATPVLNDLLAIHKRTLGRGTPSPRDVITRAIEVDQDVAST
jgi:hypothetical protein